LSFFPGRRNLPREIYDRSSNRDPPKPRLWGEKVSLNGSTEIFRASSPPHALTKMSVCSKFPLLSVHGTRVSKIGCHKCTTAYTQCVIFFKTRFEYRRKTCPWYLHSHQIYPLPHTLEAACRVLCI
jgi:hypothetical protein